MKPERRIIITLPSLLLLIFVVAGKTRGSNFPETPEDAFAAIGPALVKGDFHQYPPFYNNVISPHAVVAKAEGNWFIYYTQDRYNLKEDRGNLSSCSLIFLYNETTGHAVRKGGPARLP